MVEVTLSNMLQIVQTVGILVGIICYITIMRNAQRTRESSLKAQRDAEKARQNELIYQKFQNVSLEYVRTFNEVMLMTDWVDAEEWEEKYGRENNIEAYSKWNYVIRHYQLAGVLLKQGADPYIIFELYPDGAVIALWELYEPVVEYMKVKSKNPMRLENLEYLYSEAKKRRPELGL